MVRIRFGFERGVNAALGGVVARLGGSPWPVDRQEASLAWR